MMNKEVYLRILEQEISAQCAEEGYPSHGSNFELRFEQETKEFASMSEEEFAAWYAADVPELEEMEEIQEEDEEEEIIDMYDDFEDEE